MSASVDLLRARLIALRDALVAAWPLVLVVIAGFVAAVQFIKPAPPERVVLAAGPAGGAYDGFSRRYAQILERQGVRVEIRNTAGTGDNLRRLQAGEAEVGLVQGGAIEGGAAPGLSTLGSVYYEPVWVFYRGGFKVDKLRDLVGWRMAVGDEGSGLRGLAEQLMAANELLDGPGARDRLVPLSGGNAAEGLMRGTLDAAFVIGAAEEPLVQVLLRTPGVRLMSFAQADAYQRRFPFLSRLVLPQGAADLVRDFPPEDTVLVAATTNLVVRDDLHPAIQSLLLQAAAEVHGAPGFFHDRRAFPAYKDQTFPLSAEAERYYRSGPPFLQRYLPFWAAVLVDRAVVLLLPVFALLFPLLRVAPAIYRWRVRAKIFRVYGDLKFLENELRGGYQPGRREEYRRRLDAIDDEAYHRTVPLAFSDMVYTLREHIELVRKTLDKLEAGQAPTDLANEKGGARPPSGRMSRSDRRVVP